jgi:ornithine carbamoyltransferase
LLADLMTVQEQKGQLRGLKLTYVGDAANNMANSYLVAGATAGMHVAIAAPAKYLPSESVIARASEIAEQTGGSVTVSTDISSAVRDADVVTTDTWISMGQEAEKAKRIQEFEGYTIDANVMSQAKSDAIFLHCLPAYRGYEVSADVIDGPALMVWLDARRS